MSHILILDDDDIRHNAFRIILQGHTLTHVKTAQAACNALSHTKFDLVCLDHDLDLIDEGEDPGCGMDVAEFIAMHQDPKLWPAKCINPILCFNACLSGSHTPLSL